jgi:hypothetical protein
MNTIKNKVKKMNIAEKVMWAGLLLMVIMWVVQVILMLTHHLIPDFVMDAFFRGMQISIGGAFAVHWVRAAQRKRSGRWMINDKRNMEGRRWRGYTIE